MDFQFIFLTIWLTILELATCATRRQMVTVEMGVYSGSLNPTMRMPKSRFERLLPSQKMDCAEPFPQTLGYRGFKVHTPGSTLMTIPVGCSRRVESRLLRVFNIPRDVRLYCQKQINKHAGIGSAEKVKVTINHRKKRQAFRGGCRRRYSTAIFQPTRWNLIRRTRRRNNCYNYANNIQTYTFAQPGRANGFRFRNLRNTPSYGPSVLNGALLDGLVPVRAAGRCLPSTRGNLIALVIWPNRDYHFYRLDNNGYFSHKPGKNQARNVDNSGSLIFDPRFADRGPYTTFLTFFETNRRNIRIL